VDCIVELAAVMFEGHQVLDTFERLVNPGIPIPLAASRVNGITDRMVSAAPPIQEALPGFVDFLGRGTTVAHNAAFDVGFIIADARRMGQVLPAGPVLDTRGLARRIFPTRSSYSLQNLARSLRLRQGTHRALSDAHTCRELFLRCRQHFGENALPSALASASGAPLDFICHVPRHFELAVQLADAMRAGADIGIEYRSAAGGTTKREIRPLAFTVVGGAICIKAFCRLRGEERTFRLEAILGIARPN
jgi:DNA polymerase III epsilon subunit family exonuclease